MSTRSRRGEAGFSFVELLVTIIIAGIAFAAMVPLFVQAQKTMSGDQLRNAALQLAQDKMEKIRALDYDLITQANLQSSTFGNGQFGTTVIWATGGGGSRTFTVAYRVVRLPLQPNGDEAVNGKESYKQVTVTVSWTAPPAPVKPVVLSTMVSKQYAGPQIVRFDVGLANVALGLPNVIRYDEATGTWAIVGAPVVIDAYIAPDDIASMNQGASEANRGYVLFSVGQMNGLFQVQEKVTVPVSGQPALYRFILDNSNAPDGVYLFQAMAVAGFGSRSQGMPVSVAMQFTNNAPPAPTGLVATAGNGVVYLTWATVGIGDLSHYEVWRSSGGQPFVRVAQPASEGYTDAGLTNGVTYSYRVKAVDTEGLTSAFSGTVQATPQVPADTVPPSTPAPLTATAVAGQPTIRLTWTASVDGGTPTSGLAGYIIERGPASSGPWAQLQSMYAATSYDDVTAGYGATWWYRVRAVDNAGNPSPWAGPVSATTGAMVVRSITVTNNSAIQTYVWVQNASTLLWYATNGTWSSTRPASGVWVKKGGNSVTWTNLPPGTYNVFFFSSSTWVEANRLKTQVVNVAGGNGTATYP